MMLKKGVLSGELIKQSETTKKMKGNVEEQPM